jgi:hypothetical protein
MTTSLTETRYTPIDSVFITQVALFERHRDGIGPSREDNSNGPFFFLEDHNSDFWEHRATPDQYLDGGRRWI